MKEYDLIIIGGGAGGFASAIKADELGLKTLMINDGLPLGGTCVNVGCVPSKTLIYRAKLVHTVKKKFPGIKPSLDELDFSKVIQEELELVDKMRKEKYEKVLSSLENVDFVKGYARFVSENIVEVGGERFKGKKFVIAVGSRARVPEVEGLKEVGFLTHISALSLKRLPKSMIVLGAGPVGLELGQAFSRFGCKVTILHRSERPLKFADAFLVNRLIKILEEEGIRIILSAKAKRVEVKGEEKVVYFENSGVHPGGVRMYTPGCTIALQQRKFWLRLEKCQTQKALALKRQELRQMGKEG